MFDRKHTYRDVILVSAAALLLAASAMAQGGPRHGGGLRSGEAWMQAEMDGGSGQWGLIQMWEGAQDGRCGGPLAQTFGASLYGLGPWCTYSLEVDGVPMATVVTDDLGDASVFMSGFGEGMGHMGGGMPAPHTAIRVALYDEAGHMAMEGFFAGSRGGEHGQHLSYSERVHLEPVTGADARGTAQVARFVDDTQAFRIGAQGLDAGTSYQVIVDGFLAGDLAADDDGRLYLALISDSADRPLPAEMQPIEDLRVVEVLDAAGNVVLAGSFTGASDSHLLFRGQVDTVGADGFVLIRGDEAMEILVNEDTAWRGDLAGLEDLVSGLDVMVAGSWTPEGAILALVVGSGHHHPEPVRLRGEVTALGDDGFELTVGDRSVSVQTSDDTSWHGELTGLGDLELGDQVLVAGFWTDDGVLQALAVAANTHPQAVRVGGEVTAIGDAAFDIATDDGAITVEVDENTRFAGDLQSMDDLEIGLLVVAAGTWTSDGALLARVVASGQPQQTVRVGGEVVTIGDERFELAVRDELLTVLVTDETSWHGGLTGLADLEVGMAVLAAGALDDAGALLAHAVAAAEHEQPARIEGEVTAVLDDAFELGSGRETVLILVTDQTAWRGGLTGLADLELGMAVIVGAVRTSDGGLQALVVAPADAPTPVRVSGIVRSVQDAGFDLQAGDRLVPVAVDDATRWHGMLTGLVDVESGMEVVVMGLPTDDEVLRALVVAGRHN